MLLSPNSRRVFALYGPEISSWQHRPPDSLLQMLCLNQITFLPVRMLNYLKLSFFLFLPNGYFFSSLILLWLAVMLAAEQFINLCQERFMYLFIDTTAASREPRTFNSKSVAPLLSLQWFKEVHTQQPALCLMCVFMGNVVCFYAFPGIWLENILRVHFRGESPLSSASVTLNFVSWKNFFTQTAGSCGWRVCLLSSQLAVWELSGLKWASHLV